MQIFGKYNDDRFIRKEDITYKRLYADNLNEKSKEVVMDKIGYETVSLSFSFSFLFQPPQV